MSSPPCASQTDFSLAQARKLVGDLFTPRPWIYWVDFLACWTVGVICFRLVREFPLFSPAQLLLFLGAGLLFYRVTIFTHELIHLRAQEFRAFRIVWNLLVGIPFLMPTFTYYTHLDHHRRKHFGTDKDGEYLPLGTRSPWAIVFYMSQVLIIPVLAVVRFGLLTPLTWICPPLRRWVYAHASSMIADPSYIRPLPTKQALRMIRFQELAVFGFIVLATVLFVRGRIPLFVLGQGYCTAVFILTLNQIRTLGAHRYINAGEEMTFVEQLLDSVNYTKRPWLSELWAPMGMRFHALHHLFPAMPYHHLPEAHRRLMRELPADSPYRQTEAESLPAALVQLWRTARVASRHENGFAAPAGELSMRQSTSR